MSDFEIIKIDTFLECKKHPVSPSRITQNILKLKQSYGCFDRDTNIRLFKKFEKPKTSNGVVNWKSTRDPKASYKHIENSHTNDKRFVIACVNKVSPGNVNKITDKIIRHVKLSETHMQKDILDYIVKKACAEPGYLEQYTHIVANTYSRDDIAEVIRENALNKSWLRQMVDSCTCDQSSWDFTVSKNILAKKNKAHVHWTRMGYLDRDEYIEFLVNCIQGQPEEVNLFIDLLHEFYKQDPRTCLRRYKDLGFLSQASSKKSSFQMEEMFAQ